MTYGSGGYGGAPFGGSGNSGPLSNDASNNFYGKVRVSGVKSNNFYGKVRVSGIKYVDFYGKVTIGTGKYITSYFSSIGIPSTGLTPTIDIWNVNGYHEVDNGAMVEIGDGWYVYLFANYVEGIRYLRTADGGVTLPVDERYHFNGHDNDINWDLTEMKQIRDALGVDGDKVTAVGGQLQDHDTKLDRILGLTQENQYIDQTAYTGGYLTSARLRIYSDAVSVGTDLNVIATYTITAAYSGANMTSYSMVAV